MFTESCFININTSELKWTLEDLGYEVDSSFNDDSEYIFVRNGQLFSGDSKILGGGHCGDDLPIYGICCDNNEALFLAIAALRDNSDIYQWFTDYSCTIWRRSLTDVSPERVDSIIKWHKATVEELIEYFKN